jgi:hypothetical protein
MDFDRGLLLSIPGLSLGAGARGAFGSLHVVLSSPSADLRIFLVESDAFGFAHEGDLYVDGGMNGAR